MKRLAVVDDRRIWKIAEAIRKRYFQRIYPQISLRLIDGLLIRLHILVEMEQALKTQPLDQKNFLLEAKRMEFPDYVIANLYRKYRRRVSKLSVRVIRYHSSLQDGRYLCS